MVDTDRERLSTLMAALATDASMVVPFLDAYGERLTFVVRRHLRELARPDLALDADEVEGLVMEVAFVIQRHASGWRPDGALPWTWAKRPIRSHIARTIGHAAAELDPEHHEPARSAQGRFTPGPCHDLDLRDLAERNPTVGLLCDALDEVACSPRHVEVHRQYQLQKAMGDPAPSHTVAELFGLREPNVRKIDQRVREALEALVGSDDRYRALRGSPWITAARPRRRAGGAGGDAEEMAA